MGSNLGRIQVDPRYIQVNIRVQTLLVRSVCPTCIQVRYVLKMVTRGQTWSDEEVLALLDIWSDETVQAELEGAYRNDHMFRRIMSELTVHGFNAMQSSATRS